MGTNFYWKPDFVDGTPTKDEDDIITHIGKRSSAGLYCWDCGISHSVNTRDLHYSQSEKWHTDHKSCPGCGKAFTWERKEGEEWNTTGGVELGFAKPEDVKKTGMGTCCSFTWSMMKHKWRLTAMRFDERKCIIDEYGSEFTAAEFLDGALSTVAQEFQASCNFC